MKKIFWRVFVAFGAVLLFFTILIGLMFTRFNRTNIVGAYKQQLGDLADGVVTRTSQAVKDSEADEFMDYLRAMEDFGKMQNVDIWIVADESSKHKLSDTYTNVQMDGLDIPKETENIIKTAFRGKKKSYSDYDEIYQTVMLHLAVPVRDKSGDVSGAVIGTDGNAGKYRDSVRKIHADLHYGRSVFGAFIILFLLQTARPSDYPD